MNLAGVFAIAYCRDAPRGSLLGRLGIHKGEYCTESFSDGFFSSAVGIWRSVRITVFGMNQGVSAVMHKALDWRQSMISVVELEAVRHSSIR
jgi:hypothetical protein